MTDPRLKQALSNYRIAFVGVGIISGLVNILYLTGSFFMLEVYDRVLPSRSIPTLVGLMVLALALFIVQGALEALRSRILARIGAALDEALSGRVFEIVLRAPLKGLTLGDGVLPMRDLDTLRGFLAGSGPSALFDLPWLPLYLGICFLFHPLIGVAALVGALVLAALTLVADRMTREPTRISTLQSTTRNSLAEAGRRNAEVLAAMGMQQRFARRWAAANTAYIQSQQSVADVTSGLGAFSKVFRMALQSGVLALGAYLVINGEATSGIIIASSILVSRALAPAELAIANWKGFVAARQSWRRLSDLLTRMPELPKPMALPPPTQSLVVDALCVAPPGSPRLVIQDVSFALKAGQGVGVIGASASGKSSLARALVGVWSAQRGKVRLDGGAIDQWNTERGHIGYLPQEIELFAGTIAENIARFDSDASSAAIVAAARAAGVHDLVLKLSDGYDTRIGVGGAGLSAGQRQRIGLARALYGDPFLVVLDEPNANLDQDGENALTQAILGVRARGGIIVVVAHRPSALAGLDMILLIADGRAQAFGPRDQVLKRVLRPAPPAAPQVVDEPAETILPPLRETA